MRTVRFNTFETNSSSQHALVFMPLELFDKYDKDEIVLKSNIEMCWDDTGDENDAPKVEFTEKDFYTIQEAFHHVIGTKIGPMPSPKDNWKRSCWSERKNFIEKIKKGGIEKFKKMLNNDEDSCKLGSFGIMSSNEMDKMAMRTIKTKIHGKDVVKVYIVEEC